MRTWLAGLAATIALVCLIAAVWETSHQHWWQLMVTAFMLLLVSVCLIGAEEMAKEAEKGKQSDGTEDD